MKKLNYLFFLFVDRKIHKQVGKLRRRLFLQLSETQFTGLRRRRPLPEIAPRWRWVPLIKKMTEHYNSQFCVSFHYFTGKPKMPLYGSKLVLNILLLFLKVCCFHFFKASALWADAFYKSICPSVCLSMCLSVCSLLRYRFTVFLPTLPEVGCEIFLDIRNPWWKVMERSGLTFEHFFWEVVLNCRAKKSFFFCWFCLTKHGGNHTSQWIRDLWLKGVSLILAYL